MKIPLALENKTLVVHDMDWKKQKKYYSPGEVQRLMSLPKIQKIWRKLCVTHSKLTHLFRLCKSHESWRITVDYHTLIKW